MVCRLVEKKEEFWNKGIMSDSTKSAKTVRFDVEEKVPTLVSKLKIATIHRNIIAASRQIQTSKQQLRFIRSAISASKTPTEAQLVQIYNDVSPLVDATLTLRELLCDLSDELGAIETFCADRFLEFENPGMTYDTVGMISDTERVSLAITWVNTKPFHSPTL